VTVPVCPRCGAPLLAPTVMHERYECPRHGSVGPLHPPLLPGPEALTTLAADSDVPFWLPWPLPASWLFAGLQLVGGGREPIEAVTVGFTGHGMSEGPSDLVIVAEKPGTGLGARWAGALEPDPDLTTTRPSTTKAKVGGWQTPLWSLDAPGRAAFVGQAAGCWLWLVTWPDTAWPVLDEHLQLVDLRDTPTISDVPTGALLPRLHAGPGA
jgi:hypothetical protein